MEPWNGMPGRLQVALAQRRRLLPAVAGGCLAVAVIGGAAAQGGAQGQAQDQGQNQPRNDRMQSVQGENLTQKAQREAQVQLPSLHPIVDKVMPAVVNVSVVMRSGTLTSDTGDDSGPDASPGFPGGPGMQNSPLDQFMRRFFGEPGPGRGQGPDQDQGPPGQGGGRHLALGSGFIIDPQGYVVTNNHVVSQATSVNVVFQDNTRHPAKVIGRDPKTDLALLKIDTNQPLPYLQWGDSDQSQVGDWVMAVGNPFGLGGSVTAGIISARGRDIQSGPYDDFLQTDAPINRGNSGGPTFNMSAEVIGINTAIYSPSGGSVGIGFAIPSSLAKPVVEQLREHGKVDRGWLGVQIQEVTPEIARSLGLPNAHGALVANVTPNSPAAKAGLRQGDVIEAVDGRPVERPRDLSLAVAESPIGKPLSLTVWRQGKEMTLQPVIAALPQNLEMTSNDQGQGQGQGSSTQNESAAGLQFAPLTQRLRRQLQVDGQTKGVVVVAVAPDSPAAGSIQPGDVIQSIDQQPVNSPADAASKLDNAAKSGKKDVLILLNRQGNDEYVGVTLST
jgi:serine protease Do